MMERFTSEKSKSGTGKLCRGAVTGRGEDRSSQSSGGQAKEAECVNKPNEEDLSTTVFDGKLREVVTEGRCR